MYVLLSVIVGIVGLVMVVNPRLFYDVTQSWKNSSSTEPSDGYILYTRCGGAVFLLVGVVGAVILLFLA